MKHKIMFVLLIVTMFFMCAGCTIEEDCYDCNTLVINPNTGELDCKIIECE